MLTSHGFEVRILCWDRQGRRFPIERIDGSLVRNVRFGRTTVLPSSKMHFLMAAAIFQVAIVLWVLRSIGRAGTVVIHAHDFNTLPACVLVKLLLKRRVRLIYDCHELTPGAYAEWYGSFISRIVGRLELAAVRHADGIVAANEAIRCHLRGATSASAVVIYCCPEIAEVPKITRLEAKKRLGLYGCFVVLFTGKARQDYDLGIILDAARNLRRKGFSDLKFVFIGPAGTTTSMVREVKNEGLQNLFDFRGWVPDEELLVYYVASDLCFAVTSNIGANTKVLTPIKLFESMACGVPVVLRDETLAAEIARNWGCGIVLQNPRTQFSAELMRLKENQQLLHALGSAGRRAFLTEYNWDQMQARLLHLYTGLSFASSNN